MHVLVMGGSLFNGRSLVHRLVADGHRVTVSNRGRTEVDLPGGVDRIVADRTDHETTRSALGGMEFDAVVDMSGYHPEDVELMIEIFDGNVGHYIFVSSTTIYATGSAAVFDESHPVDRSADQNEYALHKILAEDILFAAHAERGFPASVAALSMVLGPHNAIPSREQRMFARMRDGRPILVPGDGSTLGLVGFIEDQSEAISAMLGVEATFGRRFNVTGDDPHSDARYIQTCAALAGATPQLHEVPEALMDDLWDGKQHVSADQGPRIGLDIRPTDAALDRVLPHLAKFQMATLVQRLQPNLHRWNNDTVFGIDALKAATGWTPAHTFEEAMAETYEWWLQTPSANEIEHDFAWEDEILALQKQN